MTTAVDVRQNRTGTMAVNSGVRLGIEVRGSRGLQPCCGPVFDDLCPAAAADGRVPCAGGRVLLQQGTWADGAWLEVDERAGPRCPIAGVVTRLPRSWD